MDKFVRTIHPAFKMDELIFDVNLYRKQPPNSTPEHGHSYIEIVLCLEGSCEHVVNGELSTAEAGDVYVLHPGWTHELRLHSLFEHVTVACTRCAPGLVAPELKANDGFSALFEPESHSTAHIRLTHAEHHEIKGLADLMLKEFAAKAPGWQTLMRSCFGALVAQLSRFKSEREGSSGSLARLNDVAAHIEANFQKPLKLAALAKMAGLSECQFVRLFRKAYGTSPIDYLINARVDNARRMLLLRGNALSVTDIAFACGFNDSNYFCRQFKKATGFTPLRYRHHA